MEIVVFVSEWVIVCLHQVRSVMILIIIVLILVWCFVSVVHVRRC